MQILIDITPFLKMLDATESELEQAIDSSLGKMADALLTLSLEQVPLDKGELAKSGNVRKISSMEFEVGYHKDYAAFQHEGWMIPSTGPRAGKKISIKHWQNNRKGKFLEDPLNENADKWASIFEAELAAVFAKS